MRLGKAHDWARSWFYRLLELRMRSKSEPPLVRAGLRAICAKRVRQEERGGAEHDAERAHEREAADTHGDEKDGSEKRGVVLESHPFIE